MIFRAVREEDLNVIFDAGLEILALPPHGGRDHDQQHDDEDRRGECGPIQPVQVGFCAFSSPVLDGFEMTPDLILTSKMGPMAVRSRSSSPAIRPAMLQRGRTQRHQG